MTLRIDDLAPADVEAVVSVDGGNGWNSDRILWDRYLAEQAHGLRTVLIAWSHDHPIGYGTLAWASDYAPFRLRDMPEINNLCVARSHRQSGVATTLIRTLENKARSSGKAGIGIGVGLYADYGNAQRLYARLGFRPDGEGVTYRGRRAEPGKQVCLDDDLILWLSKDL
ncbi:Acetyltransferase (GNAT) family protein [bacterium YEK0313]|nr:Acetyltransferase (GNAT) family protein [bacterium YEK0313]